jgi:adenosylcobinamide kinase/adenosylcobinamide-phosphate guanylyltransferase
MVIGELSNLTLITGGARSGKSTYAESLAQGLAARVVYIATMPAGGADGESSERIEKHQARRPQDWQTIEEPIALAAAIENLPDISSVCLIDCLSLWLANCLPHLDESGGSNDFTAIENLMDTRCRELLQAIGGKPNVQFILVTNEVGSGIVPHNVVARLYRDLLGTLNQTVARSAARVWLCCVGLRLSLKA